jgi:hypothetical protein
MASSVSGSTLSANDRRILDALFDPDTLPSSVARSRDASMIDSSLPDHPTISSSQLSTLEDEQNQLVRKISPTSSTSDMDSAIQKESKTISEWPEYPSAHLNRAMLQRLKLESGLSKEHTIFSTSTRQVEEIFRDLSRAIQTATPSSETSASVSTYQARILRTAHSHRAFLYLKAAETDVRFRGKSKDELEELASADFAAAARYGDEVAREMSVRTNPYAKMCGAIVRHALMEEVKSEGLI